MLVGDMITNILDQPLESHEFRGRDQSPAGTHITTHFNVDFFYQCLALWWRQRHWCWDPVSEVKWHDKAIWLIERYMDIAVDVVITIRSVQVYISVQLVTFWFIKTKTKRLFNKTSFNLENVLGSEYMSWSRLSFVLVITSTAGNIQRVFGIVGRCLFFRSTTPLIKSPRDPNQENKVATCLS